MTLLVVSDLHLDAARPDISARFSGFLRGPARAARALYVLGDLFESWIGDDDPEPHRREVMAELRALADAGVACHYMHGNRDFLLGPRFARDVGGSLMTDPTIVTYGGRRALLTHGDALCTDDVPYQRLRAVVRDSAWQAAFLALGVERRTTLAAEARAGSKAHTASQHTMLMDVNPAAVAATLRAAGVTTLVHGHTHRPGIHHFELDGRPCERIVTGDWHAGGSVLRWDEGGLALETLPA